MRRVYYLVTLIMLLLSGRASILSSGELFWLAFECALVFIAFQKKLFTRKNVRVLFLLACAYLILIFGRNLINKLDNEYIVSDLVFFAKFISCAFLYGIILKEKAVFYIARVVTHLAVISLVLYPIQLGDSQLVIDIGKLVDAVGLGVHNISTGFNNYLFFTLYNSHISRNCGFCWEPGVFACILSLTLLFSLLQNGFKFKRQSYVLAIALITTLSTTGYIMLLIIFVLRVLKMGNYKEKVIYLVPALLIIGVVFLNTPVLYKKILTDYHTDMSNSANYDDLQSFYSQDNKSIPLNRFASIIEVVIKFKYKLILGVGNKYNQVLDKDHNFNISNGIADWLARLGLLTLIFYIRNFVRSAVLFANAKVNKLLLYVFFLVLFFGEPLLSMPLFMFFAILPLLLPKTNPSKSTAKQITPRQLEIGPLPR